MDGILPGPRTLSGSKPSPCGIKDDVRVPRIKSANGREEVNVLPAVVSFDLCDGLDGRSPRPGLLNGIEPSPCNGR